MKLFYSQTSPFVRKVMLVLHETGQVDDVEIVKVASTALAPDAGLAAANPLKKIPALARASGPTLYDSRVICEFLDQRADAGLCRDFEFKILEATGDGIMDAGVAMAYERRLRPEDKQWQDWIDGQQAKILSACAALEARWMAHLSGPLNIGQLSVAAALAYVDFRHPDAGWRTGNDQLAAWFADFESRPSFLATKPV